MNASIINTSNSHELEVGIIARKVSKTLLELAEKNLRSPETSHFISVSGIKKVRRKLGLATS